MYGLAEILSLMCWHRDAFTTVLTKVLALYRFTLPAMLEEVLSLLRWYRDDVTSVLANRFFYCCSAKSAVTDVLALSCHSLKNQGKRLRLWGAPFTNIVTTTINPTFWLLLPPSWYQQKMDQILNHYLYYLHALFMKNYLNEEKHELLYCKHALKFN